MCSQGLPTTGRIFDAAMRNDPSPSGAMRSEGRPTLTLRRYVQRRTGLSMGARGSLRVMLYRSFGARSFAGFWRYWNPIFGYGLGRYVFLPLKRAMPAPLALLATFVVSGALHDLVTAAVRGAPAFLFTPWFFLLGLGVLLGEALKMDTSSSAWSVRAAVNLAYLCSCLAAVLILQRVIAG